MAARVDADMIGPALRCMQRDGREDQRGGRRRAPQVARAVPLIPVANLEHAAGLGA